MLACARCCMACMLLIVTSELEEVEVATVMYGVAGRTGPVYMERHSVDGRTSCFAFDF